jgi:two-component system sensor histidine kinase KdpD
VGPSKPYFGVAASTNWACVENRIRPKSGLPRRSAVGGLARAAPRGPSSTYHHGVRLTSEIATWIPTGADLRAARPTPRRAVAIGGSAIIALGVATLLVAFLESGSFGITDASPVYLLAVVAVGSAFGTIPAVGTAIAAFLLYDLLFTAPQFSLVVSDPREWLDLLLFLAIALAIGRLVSIQHRRAEEADRRAAEASSLFRLSRILAIAPSTEDAAPEIVALLTRDVGLRRAWISEGAGAAERVIADTAAGESLPPASVVAVLARTAGDEPARWVRTHVAGRTAVAADVERYRVRMEADGAEVGAIWVTRDRDAGAPTREETRILALAADQVGLSLRRDQLRGTATELAIARQADSLKTALIDSVSHDLRTPLASIRATAGGLADPDVAWTNEARRAAATVIDAEATRLDRLVGGILDLSRIGSGALHPDLEPHDLRGIVEPALDRLRGRLGPRSIVVAIPNDTPPVLADAVLLDTVLTDLLENVAVHASAASPLRVTARVEVGGPWVQLTIEDGGPGVEVAAIATLFDRFQRVPRPGEGSRRGLGIGLSVVRGLVEAMGGRATAAPSPLGGLAVTVSLQAAPETPEARDGSD